MHVLSGRETLYFPLNRTSKNETGALARLIKVNKTIPTGTIYHIYNNWCCVCVNKMFNSQFLSNCYWFGLENPSHSLNVEEKSQLLC